MPDLTSFILHFMCYPQAEVLPWLFPKLLGVVYCLAFVSLLTQVGGLYGSRGVLPVQEYLAGLKTGLGSRAYRLCPTLFWLNSSDRALETGAIFGSVAALLVVAGAPPVPLLVLLWLFYLSYVTAGQEFLGYQWDVLLLEAGFMTIFLSLLDAASGAVSFTYRFFLFRFMFSSGVVKIASGDPTWRNLTAMCYHYETQPLPNRTAWHAHHLPVSIHKVSTFATLTLELAVPFMALGPAPARMACFFLLIMLQVLIFTTGNYGFFNFLAAFLAIPLLDDRQFGLTSRTTAPVDGDLLPIVSAIFLVFLLLNCCQLLRLFYRPRWLDLMLSPFSSLMISNGYGLFAVMTTQRFEFVIEGSDDRQEWRPYEFYAKPGDPFCPPRQVAPHQPRLDWQMWFAALDPRTVDPWLGRLLARILEGSPPVLDLLAINPFPVAPPRFLRLTVYRYRMADCIVRRNEGLWWKREMLGRSQPLTLDGLGPDGRSH